MFPHKKMNAGRRNQRSQWLVCLILPSLMLFSVAQSREPQPLAAGVPITRELSGGQAHSYRVTLAQGEYLEAVVEQRGVDVVVVVFAPDGQKVLEVDSPNDAQGPEPVWLIAETAGDYRLEIRSLEKNAPAGRYEVKIEAPRSPTEQDRVRVAALRAFGEASQLRQQGTVEAMRQAVARYEESLPGWQAVGDRLKEAETLNNLGFLYALYLGEPLRARDYHERELPLRRALGDQAAEAVALNNLGHICATLGEMQKALENYEQSLALRRAARDRHGEAVVLDHLGQACSEMGQLQRALEYQQQALATFRALGEARHEGVALGSLSDTLLRMGEYERALECNNQGLELVRAANDQLQEAIFLNGTGVIHFNLGDGRKALEYYQQALALHRKSGNRHQEAYTLANIGVAFLSLGEYAQALDYLRQALPLHRASEAKRGEAIALFHLGAVLRLTGELQTAKECFEAALELIRVIEAPDFEAHIRDALALIAQARGDFTTARRYSEQAIELTESGRAGIVSGQSRATFLASRQAFYEHSIDLLMQMHQARPDEGSDLAALRMSEKERARSLLELLAEARANIRQGVEPLLLAQEQALQQQLNARAGAQSKLSATRSAGAQTAVLAREIAALTSQLQEVKTQIRVASPHYAALTQPQPLSVREIQQQVLDDDTLLLEYSLGEKRSWLWIVSTSSVTSQQLPSRAEIETVAHKVYDLLTVRPAREGVPDAQFSAQAAALSRMLFGPALSQLGHKRLLIVAPGILSYLPFAVLPKPSVVRRPLSVAKDSAQRTPNNERRTTDNGQFLIADHEIVNLPSASVLSVLRRENADRPAAAKSVAVLADPVFETGDPRLSLAMKKSHGNASAQAADNAETVALNVGLRRAVRSLNAVHTGFARLPFSADEAEAILSVAPAGAGLKATGFRASRATAVSADLGQYRIVHFATHGLLNSAQPELSGLVFSLLDESGKPQDGFLRLHEIFNLKLNAELVVLSACQTGLGREIKGEGLIGLTRGFMYAGAPRVVASLWQVDDLATAELMKRFYRGMFRENLRPAAALRAAQLELAKQKRWASPFFWAAFTLQGEWR